MLLCSIGQTGEKHVAKLCYRPKLVPTEDAAESEAKIWLASELTANGEGEAET
jgi:hypothetical protein